MGHKDDVLTDDKMAGDYSWASEGCYERTQ